MIPYVVINGISSKLIKGLLICELPPISKPKIRTEIEEIDGRDGDIVTTLGFSAYDKPLSIGLYGEYDVDDIIEYFSTSGKIVFSNEPDRYYKFAIYDQIDFERLIRFKTATVNLHVQPFKYSDDETAISYSYADDTTQASITVRNSGNYFSKPTITIKGKGHIELALNNTQLFSISLASAGADETIIINSADMNAYDIDGNFMNRSVSGNYDNLKFNTGINTVTINGDISEVTISDYSRWI